LTATAPAAVPKAASARRATVCWWTVLVREREQPSNPTPAGLAPAFQTAPVEEPGRARRPTPVVPVSEMQASLQARLSVKARPSKARPRVAQDPGRQGAAVPLALPPPAAEQPWNRMTLELRRQRPAFQAL